MERINLAIIGQGRSGRNIHGAFYKSEANKYVNVAYVVESDPARRALAAEEYEGAVILDDYTKLFGIEGIDIVVNDTYSDTHYSISKDLLEHGFNVLVEKPMARTRYECDDLIRCANERGLILAVFQQTFLAPIYQNALKVIAEGKLGRVKQINISYNGLARRWDWQTLQCRVAGSTYNTGPHPIGMALGFLDFDESAAVAFSRLDTLVTSGDSDDYSKIIITAPGRCVVDIEMISTDAFPEMTVKIIGDRGTYRSTYTDYEMKYIVDGENPERPVCRDFITDEKGLPTYCSEQLITHEEKGRIEGDSFSTATENFYRMLHATLKCGTPLTVTPEMAARIISVIEKVHADNPLPVRF